MDKHTDDLAPTTPAASRRGVLECMVWAGTGLLWTMAGGVPRSALIGCIPPASTAFRVTVRSGTLRA